MNDTVITLLTSEPSETVGDDIVSLMEDGYKSLLREIAGAKEGGDGASGSSSSQMTIADRVRILNSVREFVEWKRKLKPEKPTSGISQLRDQLHDGSAGRARRGS